MPLSIHLFGPLSFHIYGAMIAVGVVAALIGLTHDKKMQTLLSVDQLYFLVGLGIASGIAGGKLLFIFEMLTSGECTSDLFAFWNAGFSVLGAFIAVPLVVGSYMYRHRLPIIASFDRACIFIPLTFAISRLGCFFAGCCYGLPSNAWHAVTYTDPECLAPTNYSIHPTQLYSAGLEFLLFLFLILWGQKKYKKTGQLFGLYLMLMSSERFLVDFLRADRTFVATNISFSQLAAIGTELAGLSIFLIATYTTLFNRSSRAARV